VTQATGKAAGFIDPLEALTGINLNPVDDIIKGFTDSIQAAVRGLDAMVDVTAEFSAEVAFEQAQTENRRIQTELNRASELGPELARFAKTRSESAEHLEEIKIAIINEFLPVVNKVVETVGEGVKILVAFKRTLEELGIIGDDGAGVLKAAFDIITSPLGVIGDGISLIAGQMTGPFAKLMRKHLAAIEREELAGMLEVDEFLQLDSFLEKVAAGTIPGSAPGAGGP
jgi:hypothetical protein